jgi:site-specific DNA recombinase
VRAALYARVSTDEQAEKYGLSSQLTELRELAAKKGFTVPEGAEFVDDGYSGATLDRPALNRLREGVRSHVFDVVLIHDPDRLTRNLGHQFYLREEFQKAGVQLEFVTVRKDESAEGDLFLNMKGCFAEYERAKIRERTSRGRKEKARRGIVVAGPYPYGYQPDSSQPSGLSIREDEAKIVRSMFSWLADGISIREIVVRLNRLGVRPRRSLKWGKSSVSRILTSATYVGRYYYNQRQKDPDGKVRFRPESERIEIAVPPVIEGSVFERARQQLERNHAILSGRPEVRFYLLQGLLYCVCGKRLVGTPSHRRRFYRCSGRDRLRGGERCRAATLSAEPVEQQLWHAIERALKNPDLLMGKVKRHRAALEVRGVEVRSEVDDLTRQLAELEQAKERLLDLILDGKVEKPIYMKREAELEQRGVALRERLAKAQAQVTDTEAQMARQDAVRRFCRIARRGLERLDQERRRQLLRMLVDKVIVRGGTLEVHGVLPAHVEGPQPLGGDEACNRSDEQGTVDGCRPRALARNRPESQEIVAASGRDLERALGGLLAADVGQVAAGERGGGEERGRVDLRRRRRGRAAGG